MKLDTQKRLAADVMNCSVKRVQFDEEELESISESITKQDIRQLIKERAITKKPVKGISRVRANKRLVQRRKGRQKGPGTKKGTKNAREPRKLTWMNKIRSQRKHIKALKEAGTITPKDYRQLYNKATGGYFRSKRHINLFIEEKNMGKKE